MESGKKVLNALGIILSLLLSVVLVLTLAVLPTIMSAISLLTPQTLVDAVSQIDVGEIVFSVIEDSGMDIAEEQTEQLKSILSSDAAKEVLSVYTQNVVDTLGGQTDVQSLTPEFLQGVVSEHIDEITQALKESGGQYAQIPEQELADSIQSMVDEKAEEIVEMLPDPEELKQALNEQVQLPMDLDFLQVLQKGVVTTVKVFIICIVAVLSFMIFGFRFVQWRGLKWLGVDLLLAGILSAAICSGLSMGLAMLEGAIPADFPFTSLVEGLVGSLSTGATTRTVIMLSVAVAFIVIYIVICSVRKRRAVPVGVATNEPVWNQEEVSAEPVWNQEEATAEPTWNQEQTPADLNEDKPE